MYCLDADVWVYFLDEDTEEHEDVEPTVRSVVASEPLFTTTVLQTEVVHYVTNQLADSERVVEQFLGLDGLTVAALNPEDVARAAELLEEHSSTGLGWRDASVLAAMERHDVDQLWTHDAAFATVADERGIAVRDPVDAGQ